MEDGLADLHWLTAERSVMSEAKTPKVKVAAKATKGSKSPKPSAAKVSSASKSAKTKTTAVLNCAS